MTPAADGTLTTTSTPEKSRARFLSDAVAGLGQRPKRLSPKYFYDLDGSRLFDAICELDEYYVTRTELAILQARVDVIADTLCGPNGSVRVVEPGAGSGTKTRLLLNALGPKRCVEYVPMDIAGEHLAGSAAGIRADLPWLRVTPIAADFAVGLPLPPSDVAARTVVYFPGSTLGNFDPAEAARLLTTFRAAAGPSGFVLLGLDLKKNPSILHAAYNDKKGVTAAFNKNVLRRMNDELGADFDIDAFDHYAFYDPIAGRVEMHLVSARRQTVRMDGARFEFEHGESICTECSYKHDLGSADRLAAAAGLARSEVWLDDAQHFAVILLSAPR